jgi:hypothetical protein
MSLGCVLIGAWQSSRQRVPSKRGLSLFFLCCTPVYSLNLLSPCFVVSIRVNGVESPRRFRQLHGCVVIVEVCFSCGAR